jgi:hypothetical protein
VEVGSGVSVGSTASGVSVLPKRGKEQARAERNRNRTINNSLRMGLERDRLVSINTPYRTRRPVRLNSSQVAAAWKILALNRNDDISGFIIPCETMGRKNGKIYLNISRVFQSAILEAILNLWDPCFQVKTKVES